MQYHRIPQHVTGYEGRIVGKFTARQFTYLAVGGIIIFITAGLPIPTSYKFIVGILTASITATFALVTYEGRSTDTWIINFVRAVMRPTQRVWVKHEIPPEFLLPGYHVKRPAHGPKRKTQAELEGYLRRWGSQRPRESDLTNQEQAALQRIAQLQAERE